MGSPDYYARVGRARYLLRTEARRRAKEDERQAKFDAAQRAREERFELRRAKIERREVGNKRIDRTADERSAEKVAKALALIERAERLEAERSERLAASKERERQRRIENRARNLELQKRWRDANRERRAAHKRARKKTKKAALRAGLLKQQRGRCAYCREKLDPTTMHVDHVIPLSKGGEDKPSNMQATCGSCNLSKSAKHPADFARECGMLI